MTSLIMRSVVLFVGATAGMFFLLDGSFLAAGLTLAAALSFVVIATFEEVL